MTDEYMRQLYQPAHAAFAEITASGFESARERVRWNGEVQRAWSKVQFISSTSGPDGPVLSGSPIPVEAVLDLGGLTPSDVRVEAVFGRVGVSGQLEETHVMSLPTVGQRGPLHVFAGKFLPPETGRLGYSLRVCPNHFEDPLTRPCDALIKWSTGSSR
jgi:starch phosphorylase